MKTATLILATLTLTACDTLCPRAGDVLDTAVDVEAELSAKLDYQESLLRTREVVVALRCPPEPGTTIDETRECEEARARLEDARLLVQGTRGWLAEAQGIVCSGVVTWNARCAKCPPPPDTPSDCRPAPLYCQDFRTGGIEPTDPRELRRWLDDLIEEMGR